MVFAAVAVSAATFSCFAWWLVDQRKRALAALSARSAETAEQRADRIAILSHEIRTPLAVVRGAAELLAEERPGVLNDHQRRFVRRIIDNTGQVIELSENLLVQTRIEAGIFDVHRQRVNLRSMLRETVAELRQLCGATVRLAVFDPPMYVSVDPLLIKQVVVNLVTNAVRSCGSSVVTVRLLKRDTDVLISVHDEGTGMSSDQRLHLFEPFSTNTRRGEGTGLGLFVSKHIVVLHGGRIFVDTIDRKGTTVMFTLPLQEDDYGE